MKVTVLVENSICENNYLGLKAEHGLSLHIEFEGQIILLDLGQSDLFIKNAKKLGIDLSKVDYLIVSHGHLDHGGGLKHFLRINKTAQIFLHKTAINKFYTKILGFIPFYVGLEKQTIQENMERISLIDKDYEITSKISIIQDFPKIFPQSDTNKALYEKKDNHLVNDSFLHEICLVLELNEKLIVFTSCTHSGLSNILNKVNIQFNNKQITAVFGGFHIHNPVSKKNASKAYIEKLIDEIDINDSSFYTGHCTGKKNYDYIKSKLGKKIQTMKSGEVIIIE